MSVSPDRRTEQQPLIRRLLPDNQTEIILSPQLGRGYDRLIYNGLIPTSSLEFAQAVAGVDELADPLQRARALNLGRKTRDQLSRTLTGTSFTLRYIYLEPGKNRYEHFILGLRKQALEEKTERLISPEIFAPAENLTLEQVLAKAIIRLDQHLQTPQERNLRQHQSDAMKALRDFLAAGKVAGLFDLPSGSGKSRLAIEIAKALGLKAVILSPYISILQQTQERFAEFAPDLSVGRYFSEVKEWNEGQILNTTYASMRNLFKAGDTRVRDLQLLICDEVDTAMGEETMEVFKRLPNTIKIGLTATPYSGQLEGYKSRGLIDGTEAWLGLFTDPIYHMPLEEGIERGILAPIKGYMLATDISVGKVEMVAGEYNQEQIELYLNKQARDLMAVALIAGADRVDREQFTPQQLEKINKIHSEIRGKRVVLIGRNKAHISRLRKMFAGLGLTAETIDDSVPFDVRRERFEKHMLGSIQILLGIRAIGRGVDLPPTEVAILTSPTTSGVKLKQDMGRAFRPSPQTGKDKAVIIQLVDKFEASQKPVLISDVLNPDFEIKGTQTGQEQEGNLQPAREIPLIRIENLGVNFTILGESELKPEKDQQRGLILTMKQLREYSVEQINQVLEQAVADIYRQTPDITPVELYKKISELLPNYVSSEVSEKVFAAARNSMEDTAKIGKQVSILLMMKSILRAADYFLVSEDDLDDVISAVAANMLDHLQIPERKDNSINSVASIRSSVAQYLAAKENVPVRWITSGLIQAVLSVTGSPSLDIVTSLTDERQTRVIQMISAKTGISADKLTDYFKTRQFNLGRADLVVEYDLNARAFSSAERELIEQALDNLPKSQRFVLERLIGFGDLALGFAEGQKFTLEKIAKMMVDLNVSTVEGVRQIQAKALRSLRKLEVSKPLRDWLWPPEVASIKVQPAVRIIRWDSRRPIPLAEEMAEETKKLEGYLMLDPSEGLEMMLEDYPLLFNLAQGIHVSELGLENPLEELLKARNYRTLRPLLVLPDGILLRSLFIKDIEKVDYFSEYSEWYKVKMKRVKAIKQRIIERLLRELIL